MDLIDLMSSFTFSCVPSKRCNVNSNSFDLRDDESEAGPRQDNEELQACSIETSDDNVFVDITQRQSKQYESEDEFVCCRNDEVLVFTECPLSTDMYVSISIKCYISYLSRFSEFLITLLYLNFNFV